MGCQVLKTVAKYPKCNCRAHFTSFSKFVYGRTFAKQTEKHFEHRTCWFGAPIHKLAI